MFPRKFSTLRTLAKISDKLISTKLVLQDVTQLKAKYFHKALKLQSTRDSRINLNFHKNAISELSFSKKNCLNK